MIRFLRQIWLNFKEYIVLAILLTASLYIVSINENTGVKNFRTFVFGSFAGTTAFFSDLFSIADLKTENNRLRKENAELMLEMNKFREYGIQNEEFRFLLNFKDTVGYSLVPGSVISKSIENYQSNFSLNVGTSHGIFPGMPVITDQGLVGLVYSSTDNYCLVRTLKNINLKLVVKNQRSRVEGILKWNGKVLVMTNVAKTADIKSGDRIITSELSALLGIHIPIGVISKLENPGSGLMSEYSIQSFADFVRTENVFVIRIINSKKVNGVELNYFNLKEK